MPRLFEMLTGILQLFKTKIEKLGTSKFMEEFCVINKDRSLLSKCQKSASTRQANSRRDRCQLYSCWLRRPYQR